MHQSTEQILAGRFPYDLEDTDEAVKLLDVLVDDFEEDTELSQEQYTNLVRALEISWWYAPCVIGRLMKETFLLDKMRRALKGTKARKSYERLIDRTIHIIAWRDEIWRRTGS